MRALSIRQPYAELILRGIKTVEYRSRATKIIGERFWIYASRGHSSLVTGHLSGKETAQRIWSDDLAVPGTITGGAPVPQWMLELAEELILGKLPTGVIVGSAVIERVEEVDRGSWIVDGARKTAPLSTINHPPSTLFKWHLTDVRRLPRHRKPSGHPQPVWFKPF